MSDFGCLSHCMMDSDAETLDRARRHRRGALVTSVVLEVALLAGLLIWPLVTPGKIATRVMWVPPVPYSGGQPAGPAHPHGGPHPTILHGYRPPRGGIIFSPPRIPPHPQTWIDSEPTAPDPDLPGDPCAPGCGPSIPGAPGDPNSNFHIEYPGTRHGTVAHPATVRRSEGVMAASLIHRVEPVYPTIAILMHLSGKVELRAIIGTDGTMQRLEVVSGNAILALAAASAVEQWRYRPTQLDNEPVEVETYITVNFVME